MELLCNTGDGDPLIELRLHAAGDLSGEGTAPGASCTRLVGIGSAVLGILIGMAGYDGNLTVQPGSAITMIRLLYSLISAVMDICVFIMLRFFKLEKMLPTVRKVNEENRKKAEEGAAQEAPEA